MRALGRAARSLKPSERVRLLGDEWWMVRAGRHDIGVYLDLAGAVAGDDTPAVIDDVAARVGYRRRRVADAIAARRVQGVDSRAVRSGAGALGLPGRADDPDGVQSRRATLLSLLGVTGNDTATCSSARARWPRRISTTRSVAAAELATAVLQVGRRRRRRALYDRYVAQLAEAHAAPEEYYRFFNALPWFRDPALVQPNAGVRALAERAVAGHRTLICADARAAAVTGSGLGVHQGAVAAR